MNESNTTLDGLLQKVIPHIGDKVELTHPYEMNIPDRIGVIDIDATSVVNAEDGFRVQGSGLSYPLNHLGPDNDISIPIIEALIAKEARKHETLSIPITIDIYKEYDEKAYIEAVTAKDGEVQLKGSYDYEGEKRELKSLYALGFEGAVNLFARLHDENERRLEKNTAVNDYKELFLLAKEKVGSSMPLPFPNAGFSDRMAFISTMGEMIDSILAMNGRQTGTEVSCKEDMKMTATFLSQGGVNIVAMPITATDAENAQKVMEKFHAQIALPMPSKDDLNMIYQVISDRARRQEKENLLAQPGKGFSEKDFDVKRIEQTASLHKTIIGFYVVSAEIGGKQYRELLKPDDVRSISDGSKSLGQTAFDILSPMARADNALRQDKSLSR